MTKKEYLQYLSKGDYLHGKTLFVPILMHFIARYAGGNYARFASDYRFLVDANLKALENFDVDMVGVDLGPISGDQCFRSQD